ncbi:putative antirestriction adenine methyltransferase [Streptomyces lavendofoliae]|uniref:Uncharacterized protein n=1 Tax=Streptomyces lavendofoliae TaxID=67314 RepID=A0A918M5E1_9ACTN|nr:hypothetical protein [Streptomyces lavendofoliae]GGU50394.1 hypothetical protein GCM10010274_43890 [Streptomyces lavendofoliae]
MFQGTIPGPMRSIVYETAATWPTRHGLWIPCAGNFTIERSVAGLGFPLHSSDVSIYSSAIGHWLSGRPCGVRLREEAADLAWMRESLDDAAGTVATLMLSTRFLPSRAKALVGHRWHQRVVEAYRQQWQRLHAHTVTRLNRMTLRLDSYHAQDIRAWLTRVPPTAPVCSFPPFYSGGYETLYAPLEAAFTWDAPTYTLLDQTAITHVLDTITDRPHWLTATMHEVPELKAHLRATIKASPRAAPFYVYAAARSRIVAPRQSLQPVSAPRLSNGVLTGDLSLAILTSPQFNALRSQYLNPNIPPGQALLAVAVRDAGRIIGVFAFNRPKFDPHTAYLITDFPVAPTRYRRLAKLILLAATSREAQLLMQRSLSCRITALATTAFTQRPVSMKYRGLFHLAARTASTDPTWRYQLHYTRTIGDHTLADSWTTWSARWAAPSRTPRKEASQ